MAWLRVARALLFAFVAVHAAIADVTSLDAASAERPVVTDVVTLRVVSVSRRGTGGLPVVVRDEDRRVVDVLRTGRDGALVMDVPRGARHVADLPSLDMSMPLVPGAPLVVVVP